jgi:DNA-binding MarR family transcriptional regulator/ribosomal protein S18 acetylase RimI-like enzyme
MALQQEQMVQQVRRFNRVVTQRVGALQEEFLARHRPLAQSRLLWEIGETGCDVRALRSRLDLDSGYVSRLLRALEAEGLVSVEPSESDGRVRIARLTAAGSAERAVLDARSDEFAAAILRPLTSSQRDRLTAAMAEVERLLQASSIEVAPCSPSDPSARACFEAYFAELAERFDGGYDPAKAIPVDDDLAPPRGVLLLATMHGEPVGCGAVKTPPGQPSLLKRMWVAPAVRGLGLGRRLLGELERHAAAAGATEIQLDTRHELVEAISLYLSAGYVEVESFHDEVYADHWFRKRLC